MKSSIQISKVVLGCWDDLEIANSAWHGIEPCLPMARGAAAVMLKLPRRADVVMVCEVLVV